MSASVEHAAQHIGAVRHEAVDARFEEPTHLRFVVDGPHQNRHAVLVRDAEILVLATHAMEIVRRWCTRVIRMDGGRIIQDGTVEEVLGPEGLTPPAAAVEPARPSPAG
jgi:ABC-type hemin transport system ATPase subunit